MRKFLSILLLVSLLTSTLTLSSCRDKETEKSTEKEDDVVLNIIDDNYRNWYEIFVYSFG